MYWPAAMEVIRGRKRVAEWSETECRRTAMMRHVKRNSSDEVMTDRQKW
ncbi:hypothetical protein [Sphingobacterium tabacisoli]|uniref:Uncharacterized protein n=1 Tax=Sphingobacterium tabacisoli TaxID=2044855 RepID=A0ABW5L2R7_9SPHI|nr:hypothetical protein [Sphingobacterium tabacisoli]